MEDDVVENPGSLIGGPEEETQGEHRPETAFLIGPRRAFANVMPAATSIRKKTAISAKAASPRPWANSQRHDSVGESNPGRCDKPTVALKRTHPTPFYESQSGNPRSVWGRGGYFRHTSGEMF